jgi:hypothetical protein|tara:strand:- start:794 stop:1192 length:399 start_codon:yes stop_codon:yes gene_type:complete
MIQRVQTVFLVVMLFLYGVAQVYFTVPKVLEYSITTSVSSDFALYLSFSALLVLSTILFFKKRKIQLLLNRIQLFLHLMTLVILSISFTFWEGFSSEDLWMLVPSSSILLLLLANKGIKKDDNLIRSLDRIR